VSDRVFLDANILVSAAWRVDSGLLALWKLTDVQLLTSAYAIAEADRNSETPERRTRLHRLVQSVEIVDEPRGRTLPAGVHLPVKDIPILLGAIESRANYLLTGDKEHFDQCFGKTIHGVMVLRPACYLKQRTVSKRSTDEA
jgi:predicted nucleic acid-binding protein